MDMESNFIDLWFRVSVKDKEVEIGRTNWDNCSFVKCLVDKPLSHPLSVSSLSLSTILRAPITVSFRSTIFTSETLCFNFCDTSFEKSWLLVRRLPVNPIWMALPSAGWPFVSLLIRHLMSWTSSSTARSTTLLAMLSVTESLITSWAKSAISDLEATKLQLTNS